MEIFDRRSIRRAEQTLKCLSFNSSFYNDVRNKGLAAQQVFQNYELYSTNAKKFFSLQKIESDFCWMIKVGILRREVDGQGLTSSVRLTPSGRIIIEKNNILPDLKPSMIEYAIYLLYRYLIRR